MKQTIVHSFRYSLRLSLPIFISFVPVGLAYGILMQSAGYGWMWCAACSLSIAGGTLCCMLLTQLVF